MKRVIRIVAILAAVIIIIITTTRDKTPTLNDNVTADNYVLNFTLNGLDGKPVDFNDFKGKVLILDVWDTWCPPCKAEIPDFIELYSQYKDKEFLMIGAVIGREGLNTVRQFINTYKINYPTVLFEEKLMDIFGEIQGIP